MIAVQIKLFACCSSGISKKIRDSYFMLFNNPINRHSSVRWNDGGVVKMLLVAAFLLLTGFILDKSVIT